MGSRETQHLLADKVTEITRLWMCQAVSARPCWWRFPSEFWRRMTVSAI